LGDIAENSENSSFQDYFQQSESEATVVCQNRQTGSLTFNWSEITQRHRAIADFEEEVVVEPPYGKLQRKTQTQDYVQFCDYIFLESFAFYGYDLSYQFQQNCSCPSTEPILNNN